MPRYRRFALSLVPACLALAGCTKPHPDAAPGKAAEPVLASGVASTPRAAADAASPSPSPSPAPPASVTPATAEPPLHVKIVTIGMHVGGGPYDEPTKEPIKRSVEPHFAELARCWKLVANPRPADVGVDLVIEAAGGHARVSNPRTTVATEGFVPCVVAFYEGVDFLKPKSGKTVVSYSVRFLP